MNAPAPYLWSDHAALANFTAMPVAAIRRRGVAPPLSPALDRPAVDANQLGQLSHPRGGRALPHDRDQRDHRGEIDLAPEEPERRRRSACSATVAGAAEAEAPIMLLAEPGRTATRLAAKQGRMQTYC